MASVIPLRDGESVLITAPGYKLHATRTGERFSYTAWLAAPSLLDAIARAADNQTDDGYYSGDQLPAELEGRFEFVKV